MRSGRTIYRQACKDRRKQDSRETVASMTGGRQLRNDGYGGVFCLVPSLPFCSGKKLGGEERGRRKRDTSEDSPLSRPGHGGGGRAEQKVGGLARAPPAGREGRDEGGVQEEGRKED